jgi:polysaccharide chain length determinant protein (PEP-CTERM system associated)
MLPGQTYTFDDILRIAWKRKWLLLLPLVIGALVTVLYTRTLPNEYRSATTILVIPQRIPESYVRSTVTVSVEDRLTTIQQQLRSRSRLEPVITDFNLYLNERRNLPMEDVVAVMNEKIEIKIERGDAFSVSYINADPRMAQRVTERLASLFIDENLREREVLAEGTNQFLDAQLEDAGRRLREQEKRLEEYRRRHMGELPSQVNSNLQAIGTSQMQLQALSESINRDRDRHLLLERQLIEAESSPAVVLAPPAGQPEGADPTFQQLESASTRLAELEQRYTADHPDVIAARRIVRDVTAKLERERADAERSSTPAETATAVRLDPTELSRQKQLNSLRAELQTLEGQLARKQEEERRLRAVIDAYQAKVQTAPTRESEMVELTRDYATIQTLYTGLLGKREESKLASNLERRQVGERFKVLEPARLPLRPFSPNRLQLNMIGIAASLAFGVALIALVEYRDRTITTADELLRVLQLPVLAVVPLMPPPGATRRRRRRAVIGAAVVTVIVFAAAAAAYVGWSQQAF